MSEKTSTAPLSIKKSMLWNMMGSGIGIGCQWAISILVVRLSSNLEAAGLYSLALAMWGIFAPIANFGMYAYIISDVDREHSAGEYATLSLITTSIAIAVTLTYTVLTCRQNAWLPVAAFALYKGTATIIDIIHAGVQREHHLDYVGISLALQGILSLLSFVICFWFFGNLVLSILSMSVATLLVGLAYDIPRSRTLFPIRIGISRQSAFGILLACSLIVISSIATGAFTSLPRQMLSHTLGDSALGIYASVATPVAIVQVAASYIYNPLIGYFAEYFHTRSKEKYLHLLLQTFFGIIVIGTVFYVGAAFLSQPILNFLYGPEVASHSDLMPPLIVTSVLLSVVSFLNSMLVTVRATRIMVLGSLSSLAITAISSYWFITSFGMNGATAALAMGSIISILISTGGISLQLKVQFSTHPTN